MSQTGRGERCTTVHSGVYRGYFEGYRGGQPSTTNCVEPRMDFPFHSNFPSGSVRITAALPILRGRKIVTVGIDVGTHQETTKLDLDQVVQHLNTHLGPTLVALLAGVNDRKLPGKWASKAVAPRPDAEKRLRAAHRAWMTVATAETDHIARAWFIGANPHLGEDSPIEALREGLVKETLAAAKHFVMAE